ncbi:adhesive protein CupB5 [Campylobacterota bacterium]|nr:adhesive protein CupB5 [Campylobacterota bacterium]
MSSFKNNRLFKQSLSLACSIALVFAPSITLAAPSGGVVTSGSAQIVQSGQTTNINQQSSKATINWQGFSIAPQEIVNFNQPNSNALTLNRVIGNEKSVIAGALNANGKVFLINSNGVLFTKGSSVNTAGLIASTLNITDEDFNNNNFVFNADNNKQSVINLGTITISDNGYATLLGETVINDGVIIADRGTISLNSGDKITLNFNGNSLVSVAIDEGALNALVENRGAIIADGGKVILTAKAANSLIASQVNVQGVVQAQSIDDLKGDIEIYAHGGTANIDGTLDAKNGFIETSGESVKVADGTIIKADKWLIDPTDFTIGVDISGAQLSTNLETASVEIQSASGSKEGKGDINVNEAVSWNSDHTLTLTADHDININNAISVNGDGTLVLLFGNDYNILTPASFSGATLDANGKPIAKTDTSGGVYGSINFGAADGHLSINGVEYTLVRNITELKEKIASATSGNFALANSFDGGSHTAAVISTFGGTLTGLGHTISDLIISSTTANTGLIATTTTGSMIRDIGLTNVNISSSGNYTGSLVANSSANIKNVYADGTVRGASAVGGLIGRNQSAATTISDTFTNVAVTGSGSSYVGGLIGQQANSGSLEIFNSHSLGKVSGTGASTKSVGGLVGNGSGVKTIGYSYASGDISGVSDVGGLVGTYAVSSASSVSNSFSSGKITGSGGGLIGLISASAPLTISNVYALGKVTGSGATSGGAVLGAGGLIGSIATSGSGSFQLSNAYAAGDVTNTSNVGGLIGTLRGNSTLNNVYATGNVKSTGSAPAGHTGGLIGAMDGGTISNAYATGDVTSEISNGWTGGLIGDMTGGSVSNAYATGKVNGTQYAGGLIGRMMQASVTDSYATGDVTGDIAGGLVGMTSGGTNVVIENSYATGKVTGTQYAGGLVGLVGAGSAGKGTTITNSYYSGDADKAVGVYYHSGISGGYYNDTPDSFTTIDAQALDSEELAYIGDLTSGTKTLEQVQAAIAEIKEQKQKEQAQIEAQQQQQTAEIAFSQGELVRDAAAKEANIFSALFDASFGAAEADILAANVVIGGDYSANVKTITVGDQTFVLDEDEDKNEAE